MFFYYILTGHLLGDFTFQTDKIAINKNKSWKWIVVHVIIVTASMVLFAIPFGFLGIVLVLLAGLAHYIIDFFKAKLIVKNSLIDLLYFLLDQALHVLVIFLISLLDIPIYYKFALKASTIKFILVLLFVVYFCSILNQYLLRIFFKLFKKKFFMGNEKNIGNLMRLITFLLLFRGVYFDTTYFIYVLLANLTALYVYKKKCNVIASQYYWSVKLLLDLCAAILGVFMIYLI